MCHFCTVHSCSFAEPNAGLTSTRPSHAQLAYPILFSSCSTRAQMASHDQRTDVWMSLHGKVYDVTKYLEDHPGGEEVLLDSRVARMAPRTLRMWATSNEARKALTKYEIGELPPSERVAASSESGSSGGGGGMMMALPVLDRACRGLLLLFAERDVSEACGRSSRENALTVIAEKAFRESSERLAVHESGTAELRPEGRHVSRPVHFVLVCPCPGELVASLEPLPQLRGCILCPHSIGNCCYIMKHGIYPQDISAARSKLSLVNDTPALRSFLSRVRCRWTLVGYAHRTEALPAQTALWSAFTSWGLPLSSPPVAALRALHHIAYPLPKPSPTITAATLPSKMI